MSWYRAALPWETGHALGHPKIKLVSGGFFSKGCFSLRRDDKVRRLQPPVGPAGSRATGEEQFEEHHQVPCGVDGIPRDRHRVAAVIGPHVGAAKGQGLVGDSVVAADSAEGIGGIDLDAEDQIIIRDGVRWGREDDARRIGMDVTARERRWARGWGFRLFGDELIDGGQIGLDYPQIVFPVAAVAFLAAAEDEVVGVGAVGCRG